MNKYFIALVAIYCMQTTIGNAVYQGIKKCLMVLLLVFVAAVALHSMMFFYLLAKQVMLGAGIGILAHLLIFRRKADEEFRQEIARTLLVYQNYFAKTQDALLQQSELVSNAEIENALTKLPGWVHKSGFDAGLQAGYRFFLVKLEQVADVLFSLHYLARHQFDSELIAAMQVPLAACQKQFNDFFTALIQVLQLKKLTQEVKAFPQDLDELEKQFYRIAPPSLELLDIRPDYIYFAEVIFCLRDLHKHLIKLGEALR